MDLWRIREIPLLREGLKVGSEIYLFIQQAEFFAEVSAMKRDGFGRYIQHGRNIFACFTLFDKIRNLNFRRR